MKRATAFLTVVVVTFAMPATSLAQYYWTISSSSISPDENTTPFAPGVRSYYLWYVNPCLLSDDSGLSAAEFRIDSTPGILILQFTATNGFANAGGAQDLLLSVGGCPCGPLNAGDILTLVTVPGTLSLSPTSTTGTKGAMDCQPDPQLYPLYWTGLRIGDGPPPSKGFPCHVDYLTCWYCDPQLGCQWSFCGCTSHGPEICDECPPLSVEPNSWGSAKARYRD
jgi:hypothetical protein